MAPDTERELLDKVNDIHGYLFGVMGQPGAAKRTDDSLEEHEQRIVSLEQWRWYLAGGACVGLLVLKLVWGH